jgi:hypothetical protein
VRLARSQAVRRRRRARGLSLMSFLFLRLNSCEGHSRREGTVDSQHLLADQRTAAWCASVAGKSVTLVDSRRLHATHSPTPHASS